MAEFLASGGYWALLLTVALYQLGTLLQKKTGWAVCNPILLAAGAVIPFLLLTGIPNETYQAGMESIAWLLTPCTVCLGIPLYTQLSQLRGNLKAILLGITGGTAASLALVGVLCLAFGMEHTLLVTLLPKSVTTAIAAALSESAGGLTAVTATVVILTGILGNVLGPGLCRLFGITDPIAQGVAYGTASHVIGTARANRCGELTGAVSSLALVVAGILTAVLFPILAA